jgi:hypothetical protein
MAAHTTEVEEALKRVPGVQGSRVVMDGDGRINEVHVLASGDRTAKQIVRDVTTTIQAGFGLVVDYRTVSVARLDSDASIEVSAPLKTRGAGARPAVDGVAASSHGRTTEIRVQLKHGSNTYEGAAHGPANAALRLAAAAAIDAVTAFLGDIVLDVRSAEIVKASQGDLVALVVLTATKRGEETWCGSALVRTDASDAIVRATFSAMNRALPQDTNGGSN